MNCKNCNTELLEQDDYCNNCGAKVIRKRLTLKNLFEHINQTFFNYDNALLKTFIKLFKKPSLVIDSYVNGTRKRYINPINFFGLALTLSGLSAFIIRKFYLEYLTVKIEGSNDKVQQAIQTFTLDYNSLIYSMLIPFLAIISYIVFRNKKYNFTEHIIVFLYTMSLFSIVSIFIGQLVLLIKPDYYQVSGAMLIFFLLIYHIILFKHLFQLNIKQLILKTLLFVFLFLIVYILFSIALAGVMLISGTINIEDFKPN